MPFRSVIDQMGRTVQCAERPQRIISLVPSQTELLHDLGLENEVIGITKFCIAPDEWFRTKTRIGGTKQINRELIAQLQPDLIIGNKEENSLEDIEWLAARFPVWMSDIYTLADAMEMIRQVGVLTAREEKAAQLMQEIQKEFGAYQPQSRLSVAYLIWNQPCMTIGKHTFIHDLLRVWGAQNVFDRHEDERYPITSAEEIKRLAPDVLLLSTEPFPFTEAHADEWTKRLDGIPVLIVSGERFSWYGSSLKEVPAYFNELNTRIAVLKTL